MPGTRVATRIAMLALVAGCGFQRWQPARSAATDEHAMHVAVVGTPSTAAQSPLSGGSSATQGLPGIPASGTDAMARLQASPRKGSFVAVPYGAGSHDSLMLWVSLPQISAKAPVVIVIHDNQGLSTWARAVADQLAADGFIGIAPDLVSRARGGASSVELTRDSVGRILGSVSRSDRQLGVVAAATYGMSLPGAEKKYGVVGFCWGGGESFFHAVYSTSVGAAVVFYGSPPPKDSLSRIWAPVLGLYGGTDARIGATVPGTDSAMRDLKKAFEPHTFDGAGHGFLRSQDSPANIDASKAAWPLATAFLRKHLAAR
jgi:carboxymethylenebutenolidase